MSNNNSCMFKCKKKNSIDGKIYRVYQIMPLPNQFGALGLVGILCIANRTRSLMPTI